MQMTNLAIGAVALAGVLQVGASAILSPLTGYGIKINALTYEAGVVTQDRTVAGDARFKAVWEAAVINADTGRAVPGCEGAGWWDYAPGHVVAEMPLAEWVGSEGCILDPGRYQLFARYSAGEWSAVARSEVFQK